MSGRDFSICFYSSMYACSKRKIFVTSRLYDADKICKLFSAFLEKADIESTTDSLLSPTICGLKTGIEVFVDSSPLADHFTNLL